jgi:hypothetical protein
MLDDQDPRNRDFRDPPLPSDLQPQRDSNAMWGWIVGGVFLLLVIGFAIGLGRNETQVASNANSPPATTSTAPAAKPPAAPGPTAPRQ